ncbi:hypothetical protein [Bifidobacterium sp. ESL0745]|uniref:hypothetical protein n=1 Tax=Bifidobacterium sp. ESL0745 TaxID=2983226 RepID=UPI0023F81766|nr:hypothetical protein [Bifidobacterium sp. ESL0745]MDF7666013.1 hypothetical protein [Bifidobacterium sp. ESL0745]
MKPQLGDIVISRYTLVSPLRSVPGLEAWKANDRILARDCQLLIVTDKAAIPSFEAIASTLTLSRNPHFTQVIQMQHVGDIPVLITRLDQGLSLNNFIGHGTRKLGYEAMRSILAETADGLETLLHDDLKMSALSTDIVRITSKGVQIADAPVEAMFVSNPDTRNLSPEMLAVHELAALLYSMLTGEWTAEVKNFDLSRLPEDTPEEFHIICERGLTIKDADSRPSLSMVSLAELVALLGSVKPLTELPGSELKRPTSDGEASILRLALRRPRNGNILDFPQNLSTNQLQFRARQAASAAESAVAVAGAAGAAGAGASALAAAAAQKPTAAAAASANGSKATSSLSVPASPNAGKADSSDQPKSDGTDDNQPSGNTSDETTVMPPQKGSAASPASQSSLVSPVSPVSPASSASSNPSGATVVIQPNASANTNANPASQTANPEESVDDKAAKWWRQRNKTRNDGSGNSPDDISNAAAPRMDLHDLTAAEMADAFKSFDSTADDSIFPDFDPNAVQTTNPTMQFDFAMKGNNATSLRDGTPGNHTEATGRIPLLDTNGNFIEPGHESAQALQAEQEAINAANPVITPPSFTPQQKAEQTTNTSSDDIADTPLLGKLTTKAVAIIAVIVLIIAAAGIAAYELIGHSSSGGSYQQSSSDPWPNMNLNKVPFGAQGNGSTAEEQNNGSSKQNGGTSSQQSSGSTSSQSGATPKVTNADKIANAVPAPSIPVNNTPLIIDKQEFYRQPAGQNGLAYYMHVSQPSTVTRFVVQIRTSGGTGYLIANTTQDPSAGQQVAQFTFDQSGTTEVKFSKPVNSQDFLLWVPMDSLPNHSLYINHVQLF